MYKTPSGEKKFSFTRFLTNAVPNLASAPQDTSPSPRELDLAFEYQLGEPDPLILGPLSFHHAGITSSPKTSAAIHKALLNNGVLQQSSSSSTPAVHTSAITRNFAHEVSMITSHAQKKLVHFLFWWEEEGQRWRVLMGEREELRAVIEAEREIGGDGDGVGDANVGGYEKRLKEVEGLMRLRPGLRAQREKEGESGEGVLPGYEGWGK